MRCVRNKRNNVQTFYSVVLFWRPALSSVSNHPWCALLQWTTKIVVSTNHRWIYSYCNSLWFWNHTVARIYYLLYAAEPWETNGKTLNQNEKGRGCTVSVCAEPFCTIAYTAASTASTGRRAARHTAIECCGDPTVKKVDHMFRHFGTMTAWQTAQRAVKMFTQSDKNLAIANRSRVSCAHNTSRASVITPWPWNLG